MQVTCNTEELVKDIARVKAEIKRKLKHMVVGFAHDIGDKIMDHAPLGDDVMFKDWYRRRSQTAPYLQPIHGFSRGAWEASFLPGLDWRETYGANSGDNAVADIPSQMQGYQIGQTFYIKNTGPYIGVLNARYNIIPATTNDIKAAFTSDIKYHYDRG